VRFRFTPSTAPADLPVTTCNCSFCRRHGPRLTADPNGRMELRSDIGALLRYRFASRDADFILCSRCATYVAQMMELPDRRRVGVINVNCLDDQEAFQQPAVLVEPVHETLAQKRERRGAAWTPCEFSV
jgi:hypothetical protein